MAKKQRVKIADRLPGNPPRPQSETETTSGIDVNSDVERIDRNAAPAIASVETADPATPRVDIEHGAADTGDVERGPGP